MIGKTIKELKIGDTAELSKTVSESDIYQFAGITGDFAVAPEAECRRFRPEKGRMA